MTLDWHVFGGEHHGQRWETGHSGPLFLPRRGRFAPYSDTPSSSAVEPRDQYRLATFRSGNRAFHVWVPHSLPDGEEMEHVLRLALGGEP